MVFSIDPGRYLHIEVKMIKIIKACSAAPATADVDTASQNRRLVSASPTGTTMSAKRRTNEWGQTILEKCWNLS